MKITVLDEEPRKRVWDVHPLFGLAVIAWVGLAIYVTINFLFPSPANDEDAGSRALLFVSAYIGYVIAKHVVLFVLTLFEGTSVVRRLS
jgi:hypothetical protein